MSRPASILLALFGIAYVFFLGYSFATRTSLDRPEGGFAARAAAQPEGVSGKEASALPTLQEPKAGAGQPESGGVDSKAIAAETLARWIAEAASDDPGKRAEAIAALANAPKAAAVPVLKNVLGTATDEDKQLTLQSLRTLALTQGDADGGVRDVVRQVIYHDGSDAAVLAAQAILDEVEVSLESPVAGTIR